MGAVAAAGMEIGYSLYAFGEIDAFSYVATALILLFGGLSFKFNNPVYFKFRPVAIGIALAITCLVSYAMGKPLLVIAVERYSQAIAASGALYTGRPAAGFAVHGVRTHRPGDPRGLGRRAPQQLVVARHPYSRVLCDADVGSINLAVK